MHAVVEKTTVWVGDGWMIYMYADSNELGADASINTLHLYTGSSKGLCWSGI